jgi:hypothetical protein
LIPANVERVFSGQVVVGEPGDAQTGVGDRLTVARAYSLSPAACSPELGDVLVIGAAAVGVTKKTLGPTRMAKPRPLARNADLMAAA